MRDPLTPADLDLRDFAFMPLDVMRLIDSDLNALATGDEFKAAVILWCKSWHQVPASSLPDDDRLLAHLSGYGKDIRGWKKVRTVALRGFEKCSDGRLYHAVIAEKALEAGEAKRAQRARTEAATLARKSKPRQRDDNHKPDRDDKRHEQRDDKRDDARNVHQGTGTGTGNIDEVGSAGAREPLADLEGKLREAAGWQSEPAPKLAITGQIQALIDAGADLDLDVLPTVRAIAPQADSRASWNFFVKAIARSRDDRIAAAKIVSPASNGSHRNARKAGTATTLETLAATFARRDAEGSPDAGTDSDSGPVHPADLAG